VLINLKISPSERWTLILKLGVGKVTNTGASYCADISQKLPIRATDNRPKVSIQLKIKCKAKVTLWYRMQNNIKNNATC
jgi:hypothetical protein